jgi:hypothetical protein
MIRLIQNHLSFILRKTKSEHRQGIDCVPLLILMKSNTCQLYKEVDMAMMQQKFDLCAM